MSDEGTKLTAAEAAKQAEEAIRNAEMLEKIARDAAEAAAQAREEAEQAKQTAKESAKQKGKAKKAAESIKKAAELAQQGQEVDKSFVLSYLQKHAWDLHKKLDSVRDIRFEDDPPRVVLTVVPGPNGVGEAPTLLHSGVQIPVELEVKKPSTVMVGENVMDDTENAIITEDEKPQAEDEVFHRSITGQAAKTLGVKEALGPHSMDKAAKQREAYAAWLKRHPAVKVHKGTDNE